MSARRSPIFNPDDPTILAGVAGRGVAPAAIVKSPIVIRDVPVMYDAADDGELRATELFNVPGNRNFGGTALMPAAFRQLEAQRSIPIPMATAFDSGLRPRVHLPVPAQFPVPQPIPQHALGLSTFEIAFAISAAVVVGLTAALLFVYLG